MRGTISRVLWGLCAACLFGCVLTGTQLTPPADSKIGGEEAMTTSLYWKQLREISTVQTKSDDMRVLADAIRKQMDSIRALSTAGVDAELVQHAEAVAACHERFLTVVDQAAYTVEALKKSPDLRRSFMEAGRQTGEAQARLKGLRPKLIARYGTELPHLDK
ncbi:MAG TPA: hypothetical protein VMZ71_16935 [Gemmataceae bacterium]|nr:hypothetical protein [Gemmataceae bacterium]